MSLAPSEECLERSCSSAKAAFDNMAVCRRMPAVLSFLLLLMASCPPARGGTNAAGYSEFDANQTCAEGKTLCELQVTSALSLTSARYPFSRQATGCSFRDDASLLLANPRYDNILQVDTASDTITHSSSTNFSFEGGGLCPAAGLLLLPGNPEGNVTVKSNTTIMVCPYKGEVWRVDMYSGSKTLISNRMDPDSPDSFLAKDGLDFRPGFDAPISIYSSNKEHGRPTDEGGFLTSGLDGRSIGSVMQPSIESDHMISGMALNDQGDVLWITNRNRNLIVAVNLSMTTDDLIGCEDGACSCPVEGRSECAGSNGTEAASRVLRCCNWDIAIQSPDLRHPVGLSRGGGRLAAGSGYSSGHVSFLGINASLIKDSLTLLGSVAVSTSTTATSIASYATAWSAGGDAVYAGNTNRLDRIVPSFHSSTGQLVDAVVTTVTPGKPLGP